MSAGPFFGIDPISLILVLVLNFVQGTLTPNGNVSVDCGSTRTFACSIPDEPIEWTTSGLKRISRGPFKARIAAILNPRITSTDTGGDVQNSVSRITISGFNKSDNGGTIQCVNVNNNNVRGMASISVDLHAPANVVATVESCDTVTLQWDQPSGTDNITTSVSCTPPSPGCAECTTSPCNITGLNPSTKYEFTVTLNSSVCGTSSSKTEAFQIDANSCDVSNSTSNAPLATLVLLVLLIPVIYPLGVLIAKYCCFGNKSYCEVFWCCGCCRKDTSPRYNSTELMKSPHHREEMEHQNASKAKHIQFVTDEEENKNQIGNKQDHVGTYETVNQLGDNDGVYSHTDVIMDETVEQHGYEDWITYADLDFSGHSKENINVVYSVADEVPYAAV